jgi:hypothetical protein
MKTLYILLIFLLSSPAFSQITFTQTLEPGSEDATVDDYAPGANNADEIEYFSGAWTIGGVPVTWRNYFKYDLSCIPPNATIIDASLSLYYASVNNFSNAQHSSLTNSNESVLQRVTTSWIENSITWNNQPLTTAVDQVIIPQSTSPTQDYTSLDVTAMVQEMVNKPNSNWGFSLRLTNEVNFARLIFASGDHPNQQLHPRITITYTIPLSDCFTLYLDSGGEDAVIDDYAPSNNNPDEIEYFSGAWTIAGTPVTWRNFLKFNVPCELTNVIVQSAGLSLFYADTNNFGNVTHSSQTNSNESVIQQVISPWNENQVTWLNQPAVTAVNQVILPQSTSGMQDYTNINVTAIVQQLLDNPSNNFGFLLRLTNEQYYARMVFASGDNPDSLSRPSLEICYTIVTQLEEQNENAGLTVYPMPASSSVTIKSNKHEISNIEFTDIQGRSMNPTLRYLTKNSISADISGFANGIYTLSVTMGPVKKHQKVIVCNN